MLTKSKLNSTEVLRYKALIDSVISHDEFLLTNNMLKEYSKIKKRSKKFKDLIKFVEDLSLFIKQV